jgi:hypothetical protein
LTFDLRSRNKSENPQNNTTYQVSEPEPNRFRWLYNVLASKELIISLFAILCLFLAITTFTENTNAVLWNVIRVLLALMVINLLLCTFRRIKTLSKPVLVIHIGVIFTFMGGGISTFGFVATVNIYEGTMVDNVYRWDINEDVSLGVKIMVKKLHEEFYPVPLRVGVLRGDDKIGLYTLKTGESFDIEKYSIRPDSIDLTHQSLKISVFKDGEYIGSADTSEAIDLPSDFPFNFKLVAYMDPVIKKTWVDIALINGDEIVAEGRTWVNNPLQWEGLNFHHTATNRDENRKPYVGLQITRDPGIPYVYFGFCIISTGGILYLIRKMSRRRQSRNGKIF